MKIGFLGCGAIGSIYAGYLSKVHDVCVVDTFPPVIEAVKKNGILIYNPIKCPRGGGNSPNPAEIGTLHEAEDRT